MKSPIFFLLFWIPILGFGQESREINGRVRAAATGEPLIGVAIVVQGTSQGTVTDIDGKFTYTLRGTDLSKTQLEISYLGMQTQYLTLGNRTTLDIRMRAAANDLQEVVVTSSYGTKKVKQEVVGSVTQVATQDLNTLESVESLDKLLEGQLAGVLIDGNPELGGPININIRGQGSLTPITNSVISTSTQPLIIVDGVILSEEAGIDNVLFDGNGSLGEVFQNPLSRISVEDIASFSVLKDAAAVSLYGADGANGVILITTKKGRNRRWQVNFGSQLGVSESFNRIKYLSGPQYHAMLSDYYQNSGNNANAGSPDIDTDWFELLNESGLFSRSNVSVSKGNEKWNFRASANYLNNDEAQKGNSFQSLTGSLRLGYTAKKLGVDLSLSPSYTHKDNPNTAYVFPLPPNIAPFNSDGTPADLGLPGIANPLARIEQNLNESTNQGILGSINLSYELRPKWTISSQYSIDYSQKDQDRYDSGLNQSGQLNGTFTLDGVVYPRWGRRLQQKRETRRWNWRAQTQYAQEWGNQHAFDALLGFEANQELIDFGRLLGSGFVNPGPINPVSAAITDDDPATPGDDRFNNQRIDTDRSDQAGLSLYTQLNYNHAKKYFLLVNVRRDQSSAFGGDVNTAYNGGLGLSWVLSKERWLADRKGLDFLRLRLSYGSTGNSRIGSYRSLGLYNLFQNGYNGGDYATPSTAPNPRLSWERNYKFNLGVDLNFWERYSLSLEFYHDDIRDLITTRQIPLEIGYGNVQINGADMFNEGIELSLKADWLNQPKIRWTTNFNISTNRNKVVALRGLGSSFSLAERARAQRVGFSTSAIWGIRGGFVDPATGRELFYRQGNLYDAISYSQRFGQESWEVIGDSQPDFYGGFTNRFTFWNRLQLTVAASFTYGAQTLIDDELESQYRVMVNRNLSANAFDYWRQEGDIARHPRVISTNPILQNSTKFLYETSHLKIKSINLNYRIPVENIKWRIQQATVFADISNVLYWYKERSPRGGNGIREYRFIYPEMRSYTFGLRVTL